MTGPTGPQDSSSGSFGSQEPERRGRGLPRRSWFTLGTIVKLLLLGAVNAIVLAGLPTMLEQKWWVGIIIVGLSTILIDYAYLRKGAIPLKYLVPGTIFALAFQVVPVLYSGYIAFTNFSTGHRLSEVQVVEQLSSRISNVPGSTRFGLTILGADEGAGDIAFILTDDTGTRYLGTAEGLEAITPDRVGVGDNGKVASVDGYTALAIRQIADRQQEILDQFEVPTDQGIIRAATVTTAAIYERLYVYDEATGILTNTETDTAYRPVDGRFVSGAGEALDPGWVVPVGFDNFVRIFTSESIRGPFIQVFVWNYMF